MESTKVLEDLDYLVLKLTLLVRPALNNTEGSVKLAQQKCKGQAFSRGLVRCMEKLRKGNEWVIGDFDMCYHIDAHFER